MAETFLPSFINKVLCIIHADVTCTISQYEPFVIVPKFKTLVCL